MREGSKDMRLPRRGWRRALPLGGALAALALAGPAARAYYPPHHDPNPPSINIPAGITYPTPPHLPVNTPQAEPDPPVHTTPEPGTLILGLIGGGIAAASARRKKKSDQVTG
jgi:hypothetical protein